jgi:hypothetical protein
VIELRCREQAREVDLECQGGGGEEEKTQPDASCDAMPPPFCMFVSFAAIRVVKFLHEVRPFLQLREFAGGVR